MSATLIRQDQLGSLDPVGVSVRLSVARVLVTPWPFFQGSGFVSTSAKR